MSPRELQEAIDKVIPHLTGNMKTYQLDQYNTHLNHLKKLYELQVAMAGRMTTETVTKPGSFYEI